MTEKTNLGLGVESGTFRLWTKRALPLIAEISLHGVHKKKGIVKTFERPGKNKFLGYMMLVKS